jgi:signal transduction histidine kinase/ligand-binding sensor domain-containing protein
MKPGKKMVLLKFLIFLIIFSSQLYSSSSNTYVVRNYSDKDGLSMNIGNALVQDERGYIWIGCQYGLNRFDGVNVRVFTREDGLPDNFINHLYQDSHDDLWVATRGGLARFDYEKERFEAFAKENHGLTHNYVRCIGESKHLGLLVGTEEGLTVITKDGKVEDFTKKYPLLKEKIQCIEVNEQDNEIYLGTLGSGLLIFRKENVERIEKSGGGLPDNNINALKSTVRGLWIGTDAGLTLFSGGKCVKTFTSDNPSRANNAVKALLLDNDGNYWIATADGLFLMKDGKISKDPASTKLGGNNIICLYEDYEGSIWVGANGGVSCLTRSKFRVYSKEDGLPENLSFGIFENTDGKIWVATYGGIGIIDESKQPAKIYKFTADNSKLASNSVRTITRDSQGTIWIASLSGGLVKYAGNTFNSYTTESGLPGNNVRIVYVDNRDRLWLGMQDAGLVLFDKQKGITKYLYNSRNSNLLNDNVWFIKEDSMGNLWIGVDGGISKFDPKSKTFTNYSKEQEIESNFSTGILEEDNGYWIATFGGGLYFLDKNLPKGNKVKQYTTHDGLPDNCVYGVEKDNQGWLWLATNKGVCRWDKKETFHYYTVDHGLPSNENDTPGCFKDSNGRIWFSTPKGVAYIDPGNIYINKKIPPVYIEAVRVNNNVFAYRKAPLVLSHDQNNIFIKFTALSYQYPRGVRFKFKLEGFHEDWQAPHEGNRFAEFTNLSPADYTFRVIACNNDGVWGEKGTSLVFTIKPAFYQTIWFYILCGLGAFLLVYGYFRYRSKQQKKLEQKVNKRIAELNKLQLRLYQQDKMSSLGVLVAGVAHEMNNPANSIYGNAKFLQKFMGDIKIILARYMELEFPSDHEINTLRTQLGIDNKIEEIDGLVKYIREGALRISDIVQALRNFAHMNEADFQRTDIHKGIDDTLFLLNNKIKYKAEVVKKFGDIPPIECYAGQLNQVFMNLLSNAADAIRDQGVITIETRMEKDDYVIIRITDTGEGILEKNQARIFEPFFTTKKANEGTGLGLSITHSIIKDHNGSIEFESTLGKGTTFIVKLPIKQSKKEKVRKSMNPGAGDDGKSI